MILQARHIRLPLLEAQITRMMFRQEHVPFFAAPSLHVASVRQWIMASTTTTIAVHPSVDWIGEHLIDHLVARTAPDDLRAKATAVDLVWKLQALPVQAQQHAAHRAQLAEQVHDLLHG